MKSRVGGKYGGDKVKVAGKVDTSVPSDDILTYEVKDLIVKRTVTVLDKMNPERELNEADTPQNVKFGDKYT